MLIAHKIALDLNNVQATYMARAAGTARFAYNWALAEWQRQYAAHRADPSLPRPSQAALRRRRFRQDAAGEVLRHPSGIVPFGWVLQSFVRAPNAAQYVAEARCVASLAASNRLPGGALRSSGRFVAFTLKSLR